MSRPGFAIALLAGFIGFPLAEVRAEDGFEVVRDVIYATRKDERLHADVYVPKESGPHPGVLVVHGGAWATGTRNQLAGVARYLAENGYTALAITYRLAPEHPWPAQIEDVRDALKFMATEHERYKIDPDRLAGFGYSAGGHLVSLLGAQQRPAVERQADAKGADPVDALPRLQAVVAGGTPTDFRWLPAKNRRLAYWLGGSRTERPDAYREASPLVHLTGYAPPMFFFHGTNDRLVPIASPALMVTMAKLLGVEAHLHTIPDAGHMGAMYNPEAARASLQFLNAKLKPSVAEPDAVTPEDARNDEQRERNSAR